MGFIIAFVIFILGLVIGSFGIIQIVTILRFALPFTNQLIQLTVLSYNDGSRIKKSNISTIIIWIFITTVAILLIYNFANYLSFYAFLLGSGLSFVYGVSHTGFTESNKQEYISNYGNLFNEDVVNYINSQCNVGE